LFAKFFYIFLGFSTLVYVNMRTFAHVRARALTRHTHTQTRTHIVHACCTFKSCLDGIKLLETCVQPTVYPKILNPRNCGIHCRWYFDMFIRCRLLKAIKNVDDIGHSPIYTKHLSIISVLFKY